MFSLVVASAVTNAYAPIAHSSSANTVPLLQNADAILPPWPRHMVGDRLQQATILKCAIPVSNSKASTPMVVRRGILFSITVVPVPRHAYPLATFTQIISFATQTDHVCMDELACANCIPHKMRTCHHCQQWFCSRDGLRCCTNEECGVAYCSTCCQTSETIREMPQSCSDCGLRLCYECNSGLYVPCADCSKLLQLEDKGSPSTGGVPPCEECHTFERVELQACHGACQGVYCSHVEFSGSPDDRVVSQCNPCRRFFPCGLDCENLLCHKCISAGNPVCKECLEDKGGGKKKRKRQKDTTELQMESSLPTHEKDSGNACKQATEDRNPYAEAEQAVARSTKERPFSKEAATSTPWDSAQESAQRDDDENNVSSDASEPIIHRRPRAGVVQKRDLFGDSSDSDYGT